MTLTVACADIGSADPKKNRFGWALRRLKPCEPSVWSDGVDMPGFVDAIVDAIGDGRVALGFECPMWVPVTEDPRDLTKKRCGDWVPRDDGKSQPRPWSAGAGAAVTGVGLTQIAWILERVKQKAGTCPEVFFDWRCFTEAETGVFFWEALVSGGKAGQSGEGLEHVADAQAAIDCFVEKSGKDPMVAMSTQCANCEDQPCKHTGRVRSLVGGALLWAGWSTEVALLHQPCVVVRTTKGARGTCI